MHRFFVTKPEGIQARIIGEDVRHIAKVLRLTAGETVALCDGQGNECLAVIDSVCSDAVICTCAQWLPSPAESSCRVTLFQGLPKAGKMETIIQKCVELGVDTVVPTEMARCVVVPGADYGKKLVRYRRVAEEAAKQSGRGRIPHIEKLCTLSDIDLTPFDAAFVAYEEERAVSFKMALSGLQPRNAALIIGPEGGLERGEIETLAGKGAVCVSLGKRILRTETAGMAMLAQLMYEVEP